MISIENFTSSTSRINAGPDEIKAIHSSLNILYTSVTILYKNIQRKKHEYIGILVYDDSKTYVITKDMIGFGLSIPLNLIFKDLLIKIKHSHMLADKTKDKAEKLFGNIDLTMNNSTDIVNNIRSNVYPGMDIDEKIDTIINGVNLAFIEYEKFYNTFLDLINFIKDEVSTDITIHYLMK